MATDLNSHADEFPNNSKSFIELGDLYMTHGEYEQARSHFHKALLIESDEISVELSLAKINTELGIFSQAQKDYYAILETCRTAQEKFDVYKSLESFFFRRGQTESIWTIIYYQVVT
jgi:Tfp pilus assembly protein PilF